jgi:hypothetical protein
MGGAVSLGNHEQGGTPFPDQRLGSMVPVPHEFLALGFGYVQVEMLRHGEIPFFLRSLLAFLL